VGNHEARENLDQRIYAGIRHKVIGDSEASYFILHLACRWFEFDYGRFEIYFRKAEGESTYFVEVFISGPLFRLYEINADYDVPKGHVKRRPTLRKKERSFRDTVQNAIIITVQAQKILATRTQPFAFR